MTKKEEIIESINKIALSNDDCGKYGDGFDDAINKSKDLLNKLLISDIRGQLPNNLIIYRQAQKLDYAEFCKWINSKLGDLR
jgi:hypothetical protein